MLAERLQHFRLARGLTQEALAAELGGLVTKQAISKYEKGLATPTPRVLNRLAEALGVKAAHLWGEPPCRVVFIAYRKASRLPKRVQSQVEGRVRRILEERVRLQQLLYGDEPLTVPVRDYMVKSMDDCEAAAERLRAAWAIGLAPIRQLIDLLEDHRVHVLEVEAPESFDGIAAVAIGEPDDKALAACVVVRQGVDGERQRLSLAHELGHVVLNVAPELDEEQAAFRFGAALLAPREIIWHEVGRRRTYLGLDELLLLKRKLGVSVQALLRRLRDLDIITAAHYRHWCIDIQRLGWRKAEPQALPPERPQWMHRAVLRALAEGALAQDEAGALLGQATPDNPPLSLIERKAFLKLPLDDRRRLLEEQARALTQHYEEDTAWREELGGDVIDGEP